MNPENVHIVPGTNFPIFVFIPVPVYIYVYPMYNPTQPPDFYPQHTMMVIVEEESSIPSTQPPQSNEPNAADCEQTLIPILDDGEQSLEIISGEFVVDRITSHPEPESSSETVPMNEFPPESVSLPETVLPPEPLDKTEQTLIRIWDPNEGDNEINNDELLERRAASPPRPVSLSESPSETVSLPECLHETVFLPECLHETVPLPECLHETVSPPEPMSLPGSLAKRKRKLIRTRDRNKGGKEIIIEELLGVESPLKPVSLPESSRKTVSTPEPVSLRKSVFLPKTVSNPGARSPPESLPKTVSPLETAHLPEPVSLPNTVISPDPVFVSLPSLTSTDKLPEKEVTSPPEPVSLPESLPETMSPPKLPTPPKPMSPPGPISSSEPLANTERTLIRICVPSDDGHEMNINELLGRRVFCPPEPVSPPKSLPETVSSPEPVAQAKYLSSLKSVSSTEPVSLPKTMSSPKSKTVFLPQTVSSTKTASSHGPVSPVSPPRTVSPPKPASNMSQCRTLTPVPRMWGDMMDAWDAEEKEKLRKLEKDEKFTEQRNKFEKYPLSRESGNLPPQTPHSRHTKGAELLIKGLDLNIDKERLYKEFLPFGDIISAKVITKNGRSKGFVVFSSDMEAKAAIREMNGKILGEKQLHVSFKQRMKSKI